MTLFSEQRKYSINLRNYLNYIFIILVYIASDFCITTRKFIFTCANMLGFTDIKLFYKADTTGLVGPVLTGPLLAPSCKICVTGSY